MGMPSTRLSVPMVVHWANLFRDCTISFLMLAKEQTGQDMGCLHPVMHCCIVCTAVLCALLYSVHRCILTCDALCCYAQLRSMWYAFAFFL